MSDNQKILYEARKEANEEDLKKERERIRKLNTENAIYFNFSYTALKMLGKNLYNNPLSAVAELVANGIDAKAKDIYVYINMSDKQHSTIEIIDNGTGMSYDDLAEKYVWVGRNKRQDEALSSEDKEVIMGRKGIGKLAALYLSSRYYIFSKKDNVESRWFLNVAAYKDSDFPKLDRLSSSKTIASQAVWSQNNSGTAIILENVDLRRTGSKKIEGLKRNLSDYYLIDAIGTKIWVAVVSKKGQRIVFDPVKKAVAYKNFYAIYDNTNYKIAEKIRDSISFTWLSQFEHIKNEERPTIVLPASQFVTSGEADFQREDGTKTKKSYELKGWIGIHATIDSKDAVDVNFIRNEIYHPNKLRIYVRNKLAVANYFDMRESTQTMANYIEGEISFDILDDDDLPDIATSSRQDFLDDERVEKLVELVDPIISTLFKLRNKIGQQIRAENNEYIEQLKEIERKKKEDAEKAQAEAERLAKEELSKRELAEQKAQEEKRRRLLAEQEKNFAKNQTYFLEKQLSGDDKTRAYNTHVIKSNANNISDNLVTLLEDHPECKDIDEIRAISIADQKILTAVKYYNSVMYGLENKIIKGNILKFIKDYIEEVLKKEYLSMEVLIANPIDCIFSFPPQDLTTSLENIFSNAAKHEANKLKISFDKEADCIIIRFSNNGERLPENCDTKQLFEFGYSTTSESGVSIGTGVGLYQIYDLIVEDLGGNVDIFNDKDNGVTLEIKIYEDKL